jgi:drug/metabolite transporter (DMT)-like permease
MVNCVVASLSQKWRLLYCRPMSQVPARHLTAAALGGAFVLLWSSGYPAAKVALGHGAPFTLLAVRFLVAGLLCAAIAAASGAAWPRGRTAWHSAVVGALTLALQFGPLYAAVAQGVNVGVIALIIGTMPIVTALMGLGFGETVRPVQWLGFAIGFAGVALAVGEGLGGGNGAPTPAYLAVLIGLLGVSVGTVYQKRLGLTVDLRTGLAIQNLTAAALLLPFAGYEGLRLDASPALAASLGWLIVVNSLGGFALFFLLLKRGAVSQVAALFFLMPPVTALLDYLVLGDALTTQKLAGVLVAAFGVFLATRPGSATPRPAPAIGAPRLSARPVAARRSYPEPCK